MSFYEKTMVENDSIVEHFYITHNIDTLLDQHVLLY